jgi:hypothetical protein
MNVVPTLDNITFTGNYRNAVELSPQSWTTNSLPSTTVIYWLGGDTNVQINSTLTLSLVLQRHFALLRHFGDSRWSTNLRDKV